MTPVPALQTPVLLARSKRQVCIATTDHLIANDFEVIEVASTDEALSPLESRSDIRLEHRTLNRPHILRP
ncbi:MAG: hypothetical protein ABW003_26155 [Microvirga sp.]